MANLQALKHQAAYDLINTDAFKVADAFVNDPAAVAGVAVAGFAVGFLGVMALPEIGGWVVRDAAPPAARWIVRKAAKLAIARALEEGVSAGKRGTERIVANFRDDHRGSVCAFVFTGIAKRKINKIMDRLGDDLAEAAGEVLDHIKILN